MMIRKLYFLTRW